MVFQRLEIKNVVNLYLMIAKLNGAPFDAAMNQFRKDKGMKHPFKHNKLRGAQRDRFKFCLGLVNNNYVNIFSKIHIQRGR